MAGFHHGIVLVLAGGADAPGSSTSTVGGRLEEGVVFKHAVNRYVEHISKQAVWMEVTNQTARG